jgi:hypothetical protein
MHAAMCRQPSLLHHCSQQGLLSGQAAAKEHLPHVLDLAVICAAMLLSCLCLPCHATSLNLLHALRVLQPSVVCNCLLLCNFHVMPPH